MVTEILGFIGTILIAIAYIPQMRHILKEHCSGGISIRAWGLWLIASLLIFSHAITTDDLVFKILQIVNIVAIIIIIILIKHYTSRVCHSKEEMKLKKVI